LSPLLKSDTRLLWNLFRFGLWLRGAFSDLLLRLLFVGALVGGRTVYESALELVVQRPWPLAFAFVDVLADEQPELTVGLAGLAQELPRVDGAQRGHPRQALEAPAWLLGLVFDALGVFFGSVPGSVAVGAVVLVGLELELVSVRLGLEADAFVVVDVDEVDALFVLGLSGGLVDELAAVEVVQVGDDPVKYLQQLVAWFIRCDYIIPICS